MRVKKIIITFIALLMTNISSQAASLGIEQFATNREVTNDTYFDELWQIPFTNANAIWAFSTGEDITVAVLDNGFPLDHEDLSENILSEKYKEYVPSSSATDHGTHVAGIIAATRNNNKGICGIAPDAKILPIGCVDGTIGGTSLVEAITYAKNNGAKIINMSFGASYSAAVENLIQNNSSILFVASAGNDGINDTNHYPSEYDLPNVISVGNLTQTGNLYSTSNYGSNVDIAAPGTDIYSTIKNDEYGYKTGTSMAAPCVSATGALVASVYPEASGAKIKELILNSADQLSSLNGKINNKRSLNAGQAVLDALTGLREADNNIGETAENHSPEKVSKSKVNLNNYVYGVSDKMIIQVEDSEHINLVIDELESELNLSNIIIDEYIDDIDMFIIKFPIIITESLAEDVLDSALISYAEPDVLRITE